MPANNFDAVTTSLAIDHVKNKLTLAKNVKTWLKPKGRFVIGLAFKSKSKYKKLIEKLRRTNPKLVKLVDLSFKKMLKSTGKYFKTHPKDYDTDPLDLKKVLEQAGFMKVKVIPANEVFCVVTGIKP